MCGFKVKINGSNFTPGSKVNGKFQTYKPTDKHHEKKTNYEWNKNSMNHEQRVELTESTGMGARSFMKTGKLKTTNMASGLTGWKKSKDLSKNQKLGLKKAWGL